MGGAGGGWGCGGQQHAGSGWNTQKFFFFSTKFKLKLSDEASHHRVDLCEKILKRPAKLITELKIYH